jgi:hypothetical protein
MKHSDSVVAALIAGFAVALGAACDSDSATPGTTPAGKVVVLDGQVTARRALPNHLDRTLDMGAPVYADDTVTTEEDASVRILLFHNQVVWTLEASQSRRVDATLAWRAPKGSASPDLLARDSSDRTVSAGPHAETEAAHQVSTAAPAASPAPVAPAAPAPPKPGLGGIGSLGTKSGGGAGTGTAGPGVAPPRGTLGAGEINVQGSIDAGVVRGAVRRLRPQLVACYQQAIKANPDARGKLQMTVVVGTAGKVARVTVDGDTTGEPRIAECVRVRLARAQFPASRSGYSFSLPLVFEPADRRPR